VTLHARKNLKSAVFITYSTALMEMLTIHENIETLPLYRDTHYIIIRLSSSGFFMNHLYMGPRFPPENISKNIFVLGGDIHENIFNFRVTIPRS